MINDFVGVLVIAETKIYSSFPTNQFIINGFKCPYRLDVSGNNGGIWFMSEMKVLIVCEIPLIPIDFQL